MGETCAFLVKGADPSLTDAAVHALVIRLTGGSEGGDLLAVEDYRAGADDVPAVMDACRTPPFLTDSRVVVLREANAMSAEDVALVAGYLAEPLESTVLVVAWGGGRVPAVLDKALRAAGAEVVDASAPTGAKRRAEWLASRIADRNLRFDPAARERLADHLGEDVERLEGILSSLEATWGAGTKVSVAELEPFLGSAGDVPPWDLTDAIDRGDVAGALRFLARMTGAGGRHALGVMATLHSHFSQMLALDGSGAGTDAAAAEILGFSGGSAAFRASKLRRQAAKLGSARIARAISLLADADLDLKGGTGWPPELVMEVLVARLSRLVAQRAPARRG